MDYTPVKNHPVVQAANGQPLNIVGTASFTIRLSPSLEMDLEGIAVHGMQGSCAALIGMDLLNGRKGVLGPTSIVFASPSGSSDGEIHFKLIPQFFLAVVPIIPIPAGKELANQVQDSDPGPGDFLAKANLKQLSAEQLWQLAKYAAEWDEGRNRSWSDETFRGFLDKVKQTFRDYELPE